MSKLTLKNVRLSINQRSYPKPTFKDKDDLLKALKERKINDVEIMGMLKGGNVSQVYAAKLECRSVVIKHTEDVIPFDPTEIFIGREGHNVDSHVLTLLDNSEIRIPRIIYHFPEITTTIMEDMRNSGFVLLTEIIMASKLDNKCAENIGRNLAILGKFSKNWNQFLTNETALESVYERGLELRLAYPNDQTQYHELEIEYTKGNSWVWPDGHPKNIFIDKEGNPAFIDFGRSHWGDQRYMLPNFLSHIAIYTMLGKINENVGVNFIKKVVNGFERVEKVSDWRIFCMYFGMEILHRTNGKWISGIDNWSQKTKLFEFGLRIFDEKIDTLAKLIELLKTSI